MDKITTRILENGNLLISVPISLRSLRGRKRIITPEASPSAADAILTALARGRRWQRFIDDNRFANIKDLADTIGKDPSQIARAIRLTRLSPAIIHALIANDVPTGISLGRLRADLPVEWDAQEKLLMG